MIFDSEKIASISLKIMFFTLIGGFIVLVFILFYATFFGETLDSQPVEESSFFHQVAVYVDPKTKCEYLMFKASNAGNITPRLNEDGKIICGVNNHE